MNRISFLYSVLLVGFLLSSCNSKEKYDNAVVEKLDTDLFVITESTNPIIHRIDGTRIIASELNKKIESLMEAAKVTGLAVSIINDNKIVYKEAFGYSNYKRKNLLQVNHSFYGASLSKAVFGYLTSILVSEGVIDLDKPLQEYLNFPLYDLKTTKKWYGFQDLKNDKRHKKITARMCLSHTTGFQNWRWIPRPNDLENKKKLKIYFEPGTQYYYSGEGIMLLQHVIEHITKKSIEELAQEKIFLPLQMKNTSYSWQKRFEYKYSNGHTTEQQVIKKNKKDEARASGSLETNLIDYTIFLKHVMQQFKNNSEATHLLFTPNFKIQTKAQFGPLSLVKSNENDTINLSYGLGWGLLKSPYGFGAFKEGHGKGFQHYSILFPKKEIGIVMLSNSDNAESIFKELLEISIADIYTPWKWENYVPFNMK